MYMFVPLYIFVNIVFVLWTVWLTGICNKTILSIIPEKDHFCDVGITLKVFLSK